MTDLGTVEMALEDVRLAKARMAQKVVCPPYKHALFGALFGSIVAAQAGPPVVVFTVEGCVVLAALWMFISARRRMGFFVNGYRKGRTRPVVAALLVVYVSALVCAGWCKEAHHLIWPALVLGVLMFAVGSWASLLWQRIYRRELDPSLGASI
jgi:hypothetical protein